jgi:integrase
VPASTTTTLDFALTLGGARVHRGKLQMRLPHTWPSPRSKSFPFTEAGAARAVAWYYERRELHEAGAAVGLSEPLMELTEASRRYREHRVARGNRRGSELAPRTIEALDRSLRPWTEGELARRLVRTLTGIELEAVLTRRHREAGRSACNERAELLNVLRHAQRLGAQVRPDALALAPLPASLPKVLRAVTPEEAELVVESAPKYARRHVRMLLTSGLRVGESFEATDDWLDLERGELTVPAWACKERREKIVALDAEELRVVREQLLARPSGSPYLFPKSSGAKWRYQHFWKLVWAKARKRAAARARELGFDADKLATLRLHELRSTSITYMVRAGMPDEVIAARVGHGDGGRLVRSHYLETTAAEQRQALDGLEGDLLAVVSELPARRKPETTPPARRTTSARPSLAVPLNARKSTP